MEASEEDDDVPDDLGYSRSPPARGTQHEHEAEFGRLSRQGTKDSGYSSRSDKSTKPIQQSYSQRRHTGGNDPGGNNYSTSPAQARELAYRSSQPAPKPVYRSERQDSGASDHVPSEKPRQNQYAPDRFRHSEYDGSNASAYGLSKQKSRAGEEHAGSGAKHTAQPRAKYSASNFLKPERGAGTQDRHGRKDSHHKDDRGGYASNSSRPRHDKVSRTNRSYREDRDRSPASEVSTDNAGRHRAPVVRAPREDDSDDGLGGGYGLSPRTSREIELPASRHVNFAEPKERRSVSFQPPDNRDVYSGHQSDRHRVKGDDGLAGSYGLSGQTRVPEDDDGLGGAYGLRSEGPARNDEGLGGSYGVPSGGTGPESRHARREPSYRPRRY